MEITVTTIITGLLFVYISFPDSIFMALVKTKIAIISCNISYIATSVGIHLTEKKQRVHLKVPLTGAIRGK